MKNSRLLFLFLISILLLSLLPYTNLLAQETTTFILVRHAEKMDDGTKDPALSEKGQARANSLAEHLRETEITAIYSTSYRRTLDTVEKIAQEKGLAITEHDPFQADALNAIMGKHRGGIVLISGHSNTTPHLANRLLGEEKFQQLDESEYENIYIITVTEIGQGQVIHLKY